MNVGAGSDGCGCDTAVGLVFGGDAVAVACEGFVVFWIVVWYCLYQL